ncbi:hypothetical protein GCM10025768_11090 [Microbacterium pseudoresistens]|uniref:ADP-dependent (S)-NAD(P)H-hydrate dehydratase n=1 Tax=Microbacterium pseudoresistens TaxID=640634 RepID=A0A7Y9JMN7_9MICO|nr:ADP/ATP-dependent (S)-NAD(P)H-hydrate dehydratase [Microbacterium pseudoresistens]NYD55012.1 hydroxyethylthiazole kinase-like uncharacterized protein yjeF [Microbacterium pseudoresistens]
MPPLRPWTRADTREALRAPLADDDKYRRGTVGLRTGSDAYPGAAVLGVEAAWRAGAGFVRYIGPVRAADLVLARRPETVVTLPEDADPLPRVDAWVIGSGQDGRRRCLEEESGLRRILAGDAPVVVDAASIELAPDATAPLIVTPHEREFARLREQLRLDALSPDDLAVPDARAEAVAETTQALGYPVLLKGARTLVAEPDGEILAVEAGTPWLATAGTGDVLAGVIGALSAARPDLPLPRLAAAAAWLHGVAGRRAAGHRAAGAFGGGHPLVALDVAHALSAVLGEVLDDVQDDDGADRDESAPE